MTTHDENAAFERYKEAARHKPDMKSWFDMTADERQEFADKAEAIVTGVTGERLRSLIERIERLEEEKRAIAEDIKEVYSEAKGDGFVVKTIRQIVKDRKKDRNDLAEEEALLDTYKSAIGME